MSTEKIDGSGIDGQIAAGTVDNAAIASGAAIASTKLAAWSANRSGGGFELTNLAQGTSANAAVTLAQLQATAQGLTFKDPVRAASTGALTVTYAATGGASARGQLTAMPSSLDGVALAAGNRILLKDQVDGAENGIWVISTLGSGANGIWDRALDFDADSEVQAGTLVTVAEGTINDNAWYMLATNNPITIGGATGTSLNWQSFASLVAAGAGMTQTGNTFDVVSGDASLLVNANELHVQKSGTTLATDGSGLKVADAGITATQLASGVAGAGLNGGAGTALSVDFKQDAYTGDGSQTVFTLTGPPIGNKATVSVKGLVQVPGTDYTISGTTLTLTTAPKLNWHVQASYVAI